MLAPALRYVQEFSSLTDPVVRFWNGEFDFYNNPHFNIHYPFYFLWLDGQGDFLSVSARNYLITHFHLIIGGLGAMFLARCLGLRWVSCFAAGLFFALSLSLTYLSPFFSRLASTSWTPWALAGVWLAVTGQNARLSILIGAPAVALLVFAQSSATLLYFVFTAAILWAYGFLLSIQKNASFAETFKKSLVPSGILTITAAILSAPAFIPVFSDISEYIRWTSEGPVIGSYKVPYEASLQMAYPVGTGLKNTIIPMTKLPNVGSNFIGPIFFFLILTAFLSRRHKGLYFGMLAIVFYFIVNGLGEATPLPRLTYQIPVINNIRQLTSHYILISFASIFLIGLSWEFLQDIQKTHKKWIVLTAFFALA